MSCLMMFSSFAVVFLSASSLVSGITFKLSRCSLSADSGFIANWYVRNATLNMGLRVWQAPESDFWLGVGFSNLSVIPRKDIDVFALYQENGTMNAKETHAKFGEKNVVFDALRSSPSLASMGYESTPYYGFTRPLSHNENFSTDLTGCAVWTFYASLSPLRWADEESDEEDSSTTVDLLVCDIADMCNADGVEKRKRRSSGYFEVPRVRARRQTYSIQYSYPYNGQYQPVGYQYGTTSSGTQYQPIGYQYGSTSSDTQSGSTYGYQYSDQSSADQTTGGPYSYQYSYSYPYNGQYHPTGYQYVGPSSQSSNPYEYQYSSSSDTQNSYPYGYQVTTTNILPSMYNPVVTIDSPNYNQVYQSNQEALTAYSDYTCVREDPYWCESYVREFMSWQSQYNGASLETACTQLIASVRYSDNRCCRAVQAAGCTSTMGLATSTTGYVY